LQAFVREWREKTTPLKVPGVSRLLSASAMKVGVVEPAVAMVQDTLVFKVVFNQFGSLVGSVALPTVIAKVNVDGL
jgi:hypothetical protein